VDLAGSIDIEVRAGTTRIASSRPLAVSATFRGRKPAEVAALVPLLYSVCGKAQGVAAVRAIERAMGLALAAPAEVARDLLVLSEMAREHLIRIVTDWAAFAGDAADKAALRRVMMLDQRLRTAIESGGRPLGIGASTGADAAAVVALAGEFSKLVSEVVLGVEPEAWLARCTRNDLGAWAEARSTVASRTFYRLARDGGVDLGTLPLDPLPYLESGELSRRMLGPDSAAFVAAPTWDGRPRETTPLARHAGHPLVASLAGPGGYGLGARLMARLVELAGLPAAIAALATGAATPCPAVGTLEQGTGVAEVEAARGRLVHAVRIEAGVIERYAILAPTEWNFHPAGAAARTLAELSPPCDTAPEARQLADLVVTAFDPCVACNLSVI
jgi:coenzyme F420-reducing hydrogenase alpha subunit